MQTTLKFSADHIHPRFGFTDATAIAKQNSDGSWYVWQDTLGCSRDYSKAETGLIVMLQQNACTNIRVTRG